MLFFLYGDDIFRSKEKLASLKKAFSEKNPSAEIGVFDFSEKGIEASRVVETLSSTGLFSSKKMVVIESLMRDASTDCQKTILDKITRDGDMEQNHDLVLVFWENGNPKKSLSLWKYLFSKAKKENFSILNPLKIEDWARNYLKNNYPNVQIDKIALSVLISYTGSDLFLLKNELEKLANNRQGSEIKEGDIETLVSSQAKSTVFQATEALLNKNKGLALKLFHEQIEKGEDPFYILSMYAYQIRTLLKISSALEGGIHNPHDISKETFLHPYVVQKSILQARLAGSEKLKAMFGKIQKIDQDSKTGKTDIKLALDNFIASL